ncbi:hypothetical protein HDV05_000026 [Chytridiales sp. JEL 0842]|nr:hypothetical protein HDV05_000026 [Chytridiales sp. JEL 0842]
MMSTLAAKDPQLSKTRSSTSSDETLTLSGNSLFSGAAPPEPIDPTSAIYKILLNPPNPNARVPTWAKGSNAKFNFKVHAYVTPELEKAADEELQRMKKDHEHGHKHKNGEKCDGDDNQKKDKKTERADELKRRAKMMEEMVKQLRAGPKKANTGKKGGGVAKTETSTKEATDKAKVVAGAEKSDCCDHDHSIPDDQHCLNHKHSNAAKESFEQSTSQDSQVGTGFKRVKVGDSLANDPHNPFELRIGLSFSVPAMEKCVKTMRLGERARFLCMPEECEGYSQLETVLRQEKKNRELIAKGLPPQRSFGCCAHSASQEQTYENRDLLLCVGAPLEFEIELLDIQEPNTFSKEVWEMSAIEKYKEAPKRKDEGTELYKRGDYQGACDKYTRALMLLESLSMSPVVTDLQRTLTKEAEDRAKEARNRADERKRLERLGKPIPASLLAPPLSQTPKDSQTHLPSSSKLQPPASATHQDEIDPSVVIQLMTTTRLNYAACKLKLKDYPTVIIQCTEVLNKEKDSIKALFRRAQAYMKIGRDLDLAEKDLSSMRDILKARGVDESGAEWVELKREEKELERLMSVVRSKEKAMFSKMFA